MPEDSTKDTQIVSVLQANGKPFRSVAVLNKYTETFGFGPDCLVVQIDAIENCKRTASRTSSMYAKVVKNFLDDESWMTANWTYEQFMELIQPLLAVEKTFVDMRDRREISLQTISSNWSNEIAGAISAEKCGSVCLLRVAAVSVLFKNRYTDARNALNHITIEQILSHKNKQSSRRYACLVDWTAVLNRLIHPNSLLPISLRSMKEARVCIGKYGVLRAGTAPSPKHKSKGHNVAASSLSCAASSSDAVSPLSGIEAQETLKPKQDNQNDSAKKPLLVPANIAKKPTLERVNPGLPVALARI